MIQLLRTSRQASPAVVKREPGYCTGDWIRTPASGASDLGRLGNPRRLRPRHATRARCCRAGRCCAGHWSASCSPAIGTGVGLDLGLHVEDVLTLDAGVRAPLAPAREQRTSWQPARTSAASERNMAASSVTLVYSFWFWVRVFNSCSQLVLSPGFQPGAMNAIRACPGMPVSCRHRVPGGSARSVQAASAGDSGEEDRAGAS